MKKFNRKNLVQAKLASAVAMAMGLCSVASMPVFAQNQEGAEAQEADWFLEEVVVTATKRSTSLQNTAMSVSAVTEDDLKRMGIADIEQIFDTIPGVVNYEMLGGRSSSIVMRGLATSQFNGGNPTTSIYLGDFAMEPRTNIRLVDMSRVEVLRGPQGTLYGQSAMGGTVRYMPNEPNADQFEGGVSGYISDTSEGGINYSGSVYFNIPLSESLSARAVFYRYDNSGYIDNIALGTDGINAEEANGGRLALKWVINDRAKLDLGYLLHQYDSGDGPNTNPDLTGQSFSSLTQWALIDRTQFVEDEVFTAKLSVDFDFASLNVMAANRHRLNGNENRDVTGFLQTGDGFADQEAVHNYRSDTFEARLVSNSDTSIEWLVGAWYENRDGTETDILRYVGEDIVAYGTPFTSGSLYQDKVIAKSGIEKSIYGEVGFHLTDNAKLTLGYRRSDVTIDSGQIQAPVGLPFSNQSLFGRDESVQEDVNTYRINFEYRVNDDVLVYTSATSGYRAGGFNGGGGPLDIPPSAYESDTLWDYELGVRSAWLDNRLTANAAIYRLEWEDIQLRAYDPATVLAQTDNAGEAEINGLELEVDYHINENLRVGFVYAYVDTEMLNSVASSPSGVPIQKGDRLPLAAKTSYSASIDYQRPLVDDYDGYIGLSFRYVGDRNQDFGTQISNARDTGYDGSVMPAYELLDLRLGARNDSGLDVFLFANNLLDERAVIGSFYWSDGSEKVSVNRPRTIGINMSYDF